MRDEAAEGEELPDTLDTTALTRTLFICFSQFGRVVCGIVVDFQG